jgi:NADH-quinone oxidoreductase subunit N
MNTKLIQTEIWVLLIGLGALLLDLWMPAKRKSTLGYYVAAALGLVLLHHLSIDFSGLRYLLLQDDNLSRLISLDPTAVFLKRLFLVAALLISLISVSYSKRFETGVGEYFVLMTFALLGMLFAASARHFSMMFVSIELITVSFYVLVSFNRNKLASVEAGIKYLILGALSSSILIFGMAFVYASAGSMDLAVLKNLNMEQSSDPVFIIGLLLIFGGLCFKLALVPFQFWAPDVYQGAPTPTTAFLAIGSKAAGVALLTRILFDGLPYTSLPIRDFLFGISIATVLYGNLSAIPQKNIKRLLGYSSIANAGYLLMGLAAMNPSGVEAVLVYLAAYLFALIGAFAAISFVFKPGQSEEITSIAGLYRRSPVASFVLTVSMVSLAGIPPLAGFFGKFLIFKAVIEASAFTSMAWVAFAAAVIGVVISLYYYFGVIRSIYWPDYSSDQTPAKFSIVQVAVMVVAVIGVIFIGIAPSGTLEAARQAALSFW